MFFFFNHKNMTSYKLETYTGGLYIQRMMYVENQTSSASVC